MLRPIVPLLVLLFVGCSSERRVFPHRPIQSAVVYLPGAGAMTAAQRSGIESHLPPRMPPVWFILVLSNKAAPERGGDAELAAEVFFVPDQQVVIHSPEITPIPGNHILRQGRYIYVSSLSGEASSSLRYDQVPYPRWAPNPVLIPTLGELPFPRPAGIPDATVVELILLARSTYGAHGMPADAAILGIDRSRLFPNAFLLTVLVDAGERQMLTIRQFNGYFTIDP